MSERRKKAVRQIIFGFAFLFIAGAAYWYGNREPAIASFEACVAAGYPVLESYPRQCRTPDGETFREDIGNELEKDAFIRISSPRPNAAVTSPLRVDGMVRGTWFFEADFPVSVLDGEGKSIGGGYATAEGEWMTEEFVPFSGVVEFSLEGIEGGYSNRGTLIFHKANPSGLPEHADALIIPVVFSGRDGETDTAQTPCIVTGCSGQICAGEEVVTTCEFRPEYVCYREARCERQDNGACGWTETPELLACLDESVSAPTERIGL